MPLLLLIQMPSSGEFILAAIIAVLAVLNGIQFRQKESARKWQEEIHHWTTAAQAAKAAADAHAFNLTAVRERAEQLQRENELKTHQIGILEARTDVDAVKAQLVEVQKQIARESTIIAAIQQGSKDMTNYFSQFAQESRAHDDRVCAILEGLEERISSLLGAMSIRRIEPGS